MFIKHIVSGLIRHHLIIFCKFRNLYLKCNSNFSKFANQNRISLDSSRGFACSCKFKLMRKKCLNKGSWRLPYADLGMTIAIAVMLVMLVKSLLFGFTIASIVWIALAIGYMLVSAFCDSHSKTVKTSTSVLLVASVLAIGATLFFDKPTRPKMVAFQGVKEKDTVSEEEVMVETPPPVVVDTVDVNPKDKHIEVELVDTMTIELDANLMPHDSIKAIPIL